jgi:hydroxyethylthiazole kinase-like uncharacterized protein yjeF
MSEKLVLALMQSRDLVPVITAPETIETDRYTINDVGVPEDLLMESAGALVARTAMRILRRRNDACIGVFIGAGNNGADAIVACRYLLSSGYSCRIVFLADEAHYSKALRHQIRLLQNALCHLGADTSRWFLHENYHDLFSHAHDVVVIDGIFGAGLSRPPTGAEKQAIDFINDMREKKRSRCTVISVDVPSGLGLEACAEPHDHIHADVTVTFGVHKRVHISEPTKAYCGFVVAAPIGLFLKSPPANFFRRQRRALLQLFKPLTNTAHKGNFGHVLVIEGHENYLGASRLAARAALRVGAGLVTIACEEHLLPTSLDVPEFMKIRRQAISADFMGRVDAVVIGPGLSAEKVWQERAKTFIETWQKTLSVIVLDADGLRLLPSLQGTLRDTIIIATPHPKEASQVLGMKLSTIERDRFAAIEALGHKNKELALQIIWVLKGATTLVRDLNGTIFAFRGDLPLLATGGSGDVLSGAIAGLVKQVDSPLAATLLAVSMHIEGGAVLSRRISKGSFASELADTFPAISKNRL